MSTNDCINYKPSIFDLIIPQHHVLFKLCISVDKTKLILISLIRLMIIIYSFNYLKSHKWIEWNVNKTPQILFYILLGLYVITNVIYIIILFIKKPIMDKDQLDETSNKIALELKFNQLSKKVY